MVAATAAATVPTTMPVFSFDGPQAVDVENVLTTSGWFEVMTTGILMTSRDLITANISNVNETHASMRLWRSQPSSAPEAAVVTVAKRWWSPQSRRSSNMC